MYADKWELLKEYVSGMAIISGGNTKKALQNIQTRIASLESKEKAEYDALKNACSNKDAIETPFTE